MYDRRLSATATRASSQETEQYVRDRLESVVLEDGLAAAIELAEHPELIPGANPVTLQVIIGQLLIANAFGRLKRGVDPFGTEAPDVFFTPEPAATGRCRHWRSESRHCCRCRHRVASRVVGDLRAGRRPHQGTEHSPTDDGASAEVNAHAGHEVRVGRSP